MKILISIFSFISLMTVNAFAWRLDCRAGGFENMGIEQRVDGSNQVFVRFKPGTKPSSQGLLPGECSWPDRGIRSGEATNICVKNVKDFAFNSASTGVTSCTPKPNFVMFVHRADKAPWLAKVRDETFYFSVDVVSDGSSCMVQQ